MYVDILKVKKEEVFRKMERFFCFHIYKNLTLFTFLQSLIFVYLFFKKRKLIKKKSSIMFFIYSSYFV